MNNDKPCPLCERVERCRSGQDPHFIREFRHSILVVGDHQFHRGYCVLILKDHVRELHELPEEIQTSHFQELMAAARAVNDAFKPWKLNYSCYGNQVPHIHWHILPRYDSDPDHLNHPWLHSPDFAAHSIDASTAREIARKVREHLK